MYITQHLSFQDQLHSLTPIAHKKKQKQNSPKKKKKKKKTHNVVGTQGSNQNIAN